VSLLLLCAIANIPLRSRFRLDCHHNTRKLLICHHFIVNKAIGPETIFTERSVPVDLATVKNCFRTDGFVDDETIANEQLSSVMVPIQHEPALERYIDNGQGWESHNNKRLIGHNRDVMC
jgi:hypothetical protein